jgi:uncharacterized protein YgbK (DUF1537 family)
LTALGIRTLELGDIVAPGIPSVTSIDPPGYSFVLKSGNFGDLDFFAKALQALGHCS